MDVTQLIGEMLGMLRRRILLFVGVLALGSLLSLMYVVSLTKIYQSSAVIQIEQPNIEDPNTPSRSLNSSTLQKLQIIEQRVMARDNLLAIIGKFKLFADVPGMSNADKVTQLRLAARVTQIADPSMAWRQDLSPTALNITVELSDPVMAAAIANELVQNVLDQNANRRAERTRDTLEFFQSEAARVGQAIADLETRIARFKRDNDAFLPEALEEKRTEATELRQILLDLETQMVAMQDNLRAGQDSVRNKRLQRLEEQQLFYQSKADEINETIFRAPEVEKNLNSLQRQLLQLTEQYRAITTGIAEAEMGQMLENSQKSESFQVLERALVPDVAVRPNRKRTLALGIILSAGLAAVAVLLIELRNPVIWTAAQLERQTQLRAVVAIPMIELPGERRLRRVKWLGFFAAMIVGFAALSVAILASAS